MRWPAVLCDYLKGMTPASEAERRAVDEAWSDGRLMLRFLRVTERLPAADKKPQGSGKPLSNPGKVRTRL